MLSFPLLFATVVAAFFIGAFVFAANYRTPEGTIEPPGPDGKPLVGNLLQIPPSHSWLTFKSWADRYGPIFKLNLAGGNHVIVSTEKIANELMRERGSIYSSREQFPMAAQLLSDNLRPLFLPHGELWRKGRKLMHHLTMSSMADTYQPIQEEESINMLHDLIRDPSNYERWFERYSAGLIMRLAFGQMVYTGEESYVKRILATVHTVERVASPGAYLVDTLPWLMYLPDFLAPFKREGKRLHAEELDVFRSLQISVVQRLAAGDKTADGTFTAKFLARQSEYDLSADEGAYVVGTLFEAGAGTTPAALMSFMLAMTLHPDALNALQTELDDVVGPSCLPTFTDIPHLPRVRATVKETLRWRPVTAGGVPHMLTKDDIYQPDAKGPKYFFRAGTNIHGNQWAIHREAALYPDPDSFTPERWLEPSYPTHKEPLSTYPNLQNFSAFGFGRRICPGQSIAERSLNLLVARIAWACEIRQKPGVDVPLYDYTAGFNVQPKHFDFELKARPGRGEVIVGIWDGVWAERMAKNANANANAGS